jgi:DNA-directed RNA polymerase subunit RPC12/RpoP
MRWTCPKCGKKLDISNEQLIANDGLIVCPQCLLQARQPVPTARVAAKYDKVDESTKSPQSTTSPPPHKPRMKQATTSYRYTGIGGSSTAPKKKSGKKKSKKKKQNEGMSALGCLGRTIVFTLLLFAAYVFFGLLLEALQ